MSGCKVGYNLKVSSLFMIQKQSYFANIDLLIATS